MIPPVAPLRQEWPEAFARRYREALERCRG